MHIQIIYEIAKYDLKVFHALLWNKEFREFIEGNDGYWRNEFVRLHIKITCIFERSGFGRTTTFNGHYHSIDDKPAIGWNNGPVSWYEHGKLHRDGDKPAIIWTNGKQEWWKNGKRYEPQKLTNKSYEFSIDKPINCP